MEKYLRIPFVDKGRSMDGCDCWGLVYQWYKQELGIDLPSYVDIYEDTQDAQSIKAEIARAWVSEWEPIEAHEAQEHDLIILRMRGVPMHVGIVTKPNFMLHCSENVGVSHERYDTAKWATRVVGFARHGTR